LEGTIEYALLQMFKDGGVMMYPLLLCSLVGLGVIIAKFYMLQVADSRSKNLLTRVMELVQKGQLDAAIELCEQTPGPVAAILLSALRRIREGRIEEVEFEKAVKTTGVIELGFLERGLVVLATVANVAPLMGFLGTVAGMISAFGAIAVAGQVEAALVAGGIKVALITTAAGLVIAIPVNIAYNYFVTKIDKLILEMEQGTAAVLNYVWELLKVGGLQPASQGANPGHIGAR
jgi:biopolymer transport protein ExbB